MEKKKREAISEMDTQTQHLGEQAAAPTAPSPLRS